MLLSLEKHWQALRRSFMSAGDEKRYDINLSTPQPPRFIGERDRELEADMLFARLAHFPLF